MNNVLNQLNSNQANGRLIPFEGPSFTLNVPSGWLAVADQEFQVSFIGPKIGVGRTSITVAMSELNPTLGLDEVVASMRSHQSTNHQDYNVLMESEPPNSQLPAMLRHFHWYNPETDMVMLQRQLIVLTQNYAYAVTATQPNNPRHENLDALYVQILDSFRVGELEI